MTLQGKFPLFFCALCLLLFSCSSSENAGNDEEPLSADNYITSFVVKSGDSVFEASIGANSISGSTPSSFTLDRILLDVSISDGATVSPNPDRITSLTESFVLTVTAEDGTERVYTIDIGRELSSENFITSFELNRGDFSFEPNIAAESVTGTVPSDVELVDISLDIEVSQYASITPDPSTIEEISGTFIFTVTAENGDIREYAVDISRELSSENSIVSFEVISSLGNISVNEVEDGILSQRLPSFIDLTGIDVEVQLPKYASIVPDPKEITDYSNPVSFIVTAENGNEKTYEVNFETMDIDFEVRCDQSNASKWFGGDDRTDPRFPHGPFDRNVGTGQSLKFSKSLKPEAFGVLFSHGFSYYEAGGFYDQDLEIKLDIRDENGELITSTSVIVPPSYRGGWVYFDLMDVELYLEADKTYIFVWHLINGGEIGVSTGSYAYQDIDSGVCSGQGFSGQSRVAFETNLDMWDLWGQQSWHFNFVLSGKE